MSNKFSFNLNRWSLPKVLLPVRINDLVVDIGSGSNPHYRADILVDKYIDNKHRNKNLVADRPTILADAYKLPFKDKYFDHSLCFHVLEHSANPIPDFTKPIKT